MNHQNCQIYLERVLDHTGSPDAATREHLEQCAACRTLRESLLSFMDVEPATPAIPAALDFAVKSGAQRIRRQQHRRRVILWRAVPFAAAAAVMIVVGVNFLRPSDSAVLKHDAEPQLAKAALTDWSKLEQESYNLTFELNTRQQTLARF